MLFAGGGGGQMLFAGGEGGGGPGIAPAAGGGRRRAPAAAGGRWRPQIPSVAEEHLPVRGAARAGLGGFVLCLFTD